MRTEIRVAAGMAIIIICIFLIALSISMIHDAFVKLHEFNKTHKPDTLLESTYLIMVSVIMFTLSMLMLLLMIPIIKPTRNIQEHNELTEQKRSELYVSLI